MIPDTDLESRDTSRHSKGNWWLILFDPSYLTPGVEEHVYPGNGSLDDPFIVSWLQNDARNPFNWSPLRRWLIAILAAISCFTVAFTSSACTAGIAGVVEEFRITNSVAQLGVSLFVLGFAVGPLCWGPMCESYGRQPVFVGTFGALVVCNALSASAGSITQLLVFRALAGKSLSCSHFGIQRRDANADRNLWLIAVIKCWGFDSRPVSRK